MEQFYRFAGITFRITGNDEEMYCEDGVLTPFRTTGPCFDHSISYQVVDSLPPPEGESVFQGISLQVFLQGQRQTISMGSLLPEGAHTQIRREGAFSQVQVLRREVPHRIMPRLVLNTLEAEHHIARHSGFLLHSAFIQVDGKAILFTAPSGTGKSTQAELWRKYRGARIINGDRSAVTVGEQGVLAHGIPYCGTSGICTNAELPVAAIVYLTQSPKSAIQPLTGLRAFRHVWEGCSIHTWDREDMELSTNTVMEAIRQVPVVHLACRPDESAVTVLEAYLKERR
jgi:hypothetical protein